MTANPIRDAACREVGYKATPWRIAVQVEVSELLRYVRSLSIPYFVMNGTLLGASKFRGMVGWDDDADLGILRGDVARTLEAIRSTISSTPYKLVEVAYGYILRGPTTAMLDLIIFDRDPSTITEPDPIYRMCYPLSNGQPTFWASKLRILDIKESWLFPFREYEFDDMKLWGPANDRAICLMTYGADVYKKNKRPDGGFGIHPVVPAVLGWLQPGVQMIVDGLGKRFPTLIDRSLRWKRRQR